MAGIEVQVVGLDRLIRTLQPDLIGKPLRSFFKRATIDIANRAKRKAPVDTGLLRATLAGQVDPFPVPLWGKVGTRVKYAPYQEYGTGSEGDPEVPHTPRHWPPGHALGVWASRHGFASGFQVARIIGMRGGLRPRRFLRGALEESRPNITGLMRRLLDDIRARWEGR